MNGNVPKKGSKSLGENYRPISVTAISHPFGALTSSKTPTPWRVYREGHRD